jgi:hypothetical protein
VAVTHRMSLVKDEANMFVQVSVLPLTGVFRR